MAKKQKKVTKKRAPQPSSKSGIFPTGDRVVVREIKEAEEKTVSGIFIPTSADKDSGTHRGIVIAVGPGKTEGNNRVAVSVKIGDKVLFQWGEKIVWNGEEYFIVKESEILAVLK